MSQIHSAIDRPASNGARKILSVPLINEIRAAKLGQTDKAKCSRGGQNEYSSRKSDRVQKQR